MLPFAALVSFAFADEPVASPAPAAPVAAPGAAPVAEDLQIELLEPKLKGSLTEGAVSDALVASVPLRDCMKSLAPVYEGVAMPYWTRAALTLTIEADGHVSKGSFKDSYPTMPTIEVCVAKAITATTFPAAADGKKTTVSGQLKLTKTRPG